MTAAEDSGGEVQILTRSALRALALGLGAIACWWLAARVLVPEYRPELLGVDYNSDVAHPAEWAVLLSGLLAAAGVGLAILLTLASRHLPSRTRWLIAVVVLVGGLFVCGWIAISAGPSCSFDVYGKSTTCASEVQMVGAALAMVAAPVVTVTGCLALGGLWPKSASR